MNDSGQHFRGFDLTITLAMALAGLRDIVERFGASHVGTLGTGGCAYVAEQVGNRLVPSCIVAQFFHDLGILRALVTTDGTQLGHRVDGSCSLRNLGGLGEVSVRNALETRYSIFFNDEAFELLRMAQYWQDDSYAWGEAVERAAAHILEKRGEPMTAVEILALQAEDGDSGAPTL